MLCSFYGSGYKVCITICLPPNTHPMKMNWILKGIGALALFVLAFVLFGYVTMYLWNWLMPYLFQLPTIDFGMAVGLVILSKILFGGIRTKTDGWGPRKY